MPLDQSNRGDQQIEFELVDPGTEIARTLPPFTRFGADREVIDALVHS
jgi:hypothetical protein